MLQLNPPIEVTTPLGDGFTLLIIDYGPAINTCWVVALKADGQVKHFDANDIRVTANFTYATNLTGKPVPGA